jgi:hypothetical protein
VRYRRHAKLEAAFACATHLILGAIPRRGPAVDTDRFVPLLDEALRRVKIRAALADAGYASEGNHRHAREQCGVKSYNLANLTLSTPLQLQASARRLGDQPALLILDLAFDVAAHGTGLHHIRLGGQGRLPARS